MEALTFDQIAALASAAFDDPKSIGERSRTDASAMICAAYATACKEGGTVHHWEDDPRESIDDPAQQNAWQLMWGLIGWNGPKRPENTTGDLYRYRLAWAIWGGICPLPSTVERANELQETNTSRP